MISKIKKHFEPVQKGAYKNYTFRKYFFNNMIIPLIFVSLGLILFAIAYISTSDPVFIGSFLFMLFIELVIVFGTIHTWGQFKQRVDK